MSTFEKLYMQRLSVIDNVVLSVHCVVDKMPAFNLDETDIMKAYKHGKLYLEKCERPEKIAISWYDGKQRRTIVLIVNVFENYAKVVTVWEQKGKL